MGKTKKRLLALALTAAVSITLLPGTVYAEETEGEQRTTDPCVITEGCMLENSHEGECRTAPINGENSSLMAGGQQEAAFDSSISLDIYSSDAGDGYTWNHVSRTLTLAGLDLHTDNTSLSLPDKATIVLTDGTQNTITNTQGDGISCSGDMTITGGGSLDITSARNGIFGGVTIKGDSTLKIHAGDSGIYVFDDKELSISENAVLDITAQKHGLSTSIYIPVTISGSPTVTISAGEDGILCGDVIQILGGTIDITAVNNGMYADWGELLIENCTKLSVTSENNGIYSAVDMTIKNTPLDMKTKGCGLSAENDLKLIDIAQGEFYAHEHGEAVEAEHVILDNSQITVEGEGRGISCFGSDGSVSFTNGSDVGIRTTQAGVISKLILGNGCALELSGETSSAITQSSVWTIDQGASLTNRGSLSNKGTLTGAGSFRNGGVFIQEPEGAFSLTGQLQSEPGSKVFISGAEEELENRLSQLGTVYRICKDILDYTQETPPADGDGYAWDQETKTLTLSGFKMDLSSLNEGETAIHLPEGAKIKLISGTDNTIIVNGNEEKALRSEGGLLIYGGGSLFINNQKGIAVDAGNELTIANSAVTISSPFGIAAQSLNVSYAQLMVMATEGPSVSASAGIRIKASRLGLYCVGDTVVRVLKSDLGPDAINMKGLPDNMTVSEVGGVYIITDQDANAIQTLELSDYKLGHVIIFESNCGIEVPTALVEHNGSGKQPELSRDGYTLTGWYATKDFSGSRYDFAAPVTQDLTLYAKWEKTVYEVTVLTDGNGTAYPSHSQAPEGTEITLTAAANEGFRFKEWQVVSGGAAVIGNKFIMPAGNVTVKAIFEKDSIIPPDHTHSCSTGWKSDAAYHWHECTCGERIDMAAHTFGDWTVTKAAGANEAGSREKSCTVCGYKVTETIPATGGGPDLKAGSPQTGDNGNMELWIGLLILAGAGLTGTLVYTRKKKYS